MVNRWLRIALPAGLILLWLVMGGAGGSFFGRIDDVATNDFAAYLPQSSDAAAVRAAQEEFLGDDQLPAIVLYVRDAGLTQSDIGVLSDSATDIAGIAGLVGPASPPIPSEDGKAAYLIVPVASTGAVPETVTAIRDEVHASAPGGVTSYVGGPAGFTADLVDAFSGIDGVLLLVALIAVLIILVIVYRSPLLPVIVLATASFALCASVMFVWWFASSGWIQFNGQVQGILFILVIGAATDYSLLYISRYREALRDARSTWEATWIALKGSWQPIVASGATVIAALLCMLISDLTSNKALAPVASVGIFFAMLSALTLLPAVLVLFGRVAFWPARPLYGSVHPMFSGKRITGVWGRVCGLVAGRPRTVWLSCTVILLIASGGMAFLKADGIPQSDVILSTTETKLEQREISEHFPAGSGNPVILLVPEAEISHVASIAGDVDHVSSVTVVSKSSPAGVIPVTTGGANQPGMSGIPPFAPTVVNGRVLLYVTLDHNPESVDAQNVVHELRIKLADVPGDVRVGGVTATSIDTNQAATHDRNAIIPLVLIVILLILMILLRSIVAPLLLIFTVALSYAAALGVAALFFNTVFHFPGADPAVPLFAFVFLVALGVDYNIFLLTRVREESVLRGTRPGILRGLAATGGVITSAGMVLATTFAALSVIPVLFLVQVAFIVAFGVLVDTFLVRALLVPALCYDVGRHMWWPSRLGRHHVPERDAQPRT